MFLSQTQPKQKGTKMTTPEAARRYEAEHVRKFAGRETVVYNPHNKNEVELPIIYGFNNGGASGWMHAQLLSQDGIPLGSHICSSEAYMPSDLAIVAGGNERRHEHFKMYYPDGYRMDFVPKSEFDSCEGLKEALKRNQEQIQWYETTLPDGERLVVCGKTKEDAVAVGRRMISKQLEGGVNPFQFEFTEAKQDK